MVLTYFPHRRGWVGGLHTSSYAYLYLLTLMHVHIICSLIYTQSPPNSKWFFNPITLGKLARHLRDTWTATVSELGL